MSEVWIYGKQSVFTALSSKNTAIHTIIALSKHKSDIESLLQRKNHIKIKYVDKKSAFDSLGMNKDGVNHQGIVALICPPKSLHIKDLKNAKLIAILDDITDINNIGAILRSAYAFGVDAVIVSKKFEIFKKAEVYKTSAGYLCDIKIVEVSNISECLRELKRNDFWILGMQLENSIKLSDSKNFDKIALVLGSEGKGLRTLTKKLCDVFVSIPMHQNCESLNVSVAAAVAFYELSDL